MNKPRSTYGDHHTPEWWEVVAQLGEMNTEEIHAAYAEATHNRVKNEWAVAYGLKQASDACLARLLGTRSCQHDTRETGDRPHNPPGVDHESMWLRNGQPAVYVWQPYSLPNMKELEAFADRLGLVLRVNTWPAWYYPGSVFQVELWNKDVLSSATKDIEAKRELRQSLRQQAKTSQTHI